MPMTDQHHDGADSDSPGRRGRFSLRGLRMVWRIPWRGGMATLSVKRSILANTWFVLVDGEVVAQALKPTGANPWVECTVPGAEPPIVVVQMQPGPSWDKTTVFVAGACLDDGQSLAAWRARGPVSPDPFDQSFRGPWWGPLGVVVVGLGCSLPLLNQFARTLAPAPLAGAILAFLIGGGWTTFAILVAHWLRPKSFLTWRFRRALVGFVLLGVPVLFVLLAQAVFPSR